MLAPIEKRRRPAFVRDFETRIHSRCALRTEHRITPTAFNSLILLASSSLLRTLYYNVTRLLVNTQVFEYALKRLVI